MEPTGVVSPQWKQLYQAAILETNSNLLQRRIVAAEIAIRNRIEELACNPDRVSDERNSLTSARKMLACLRRLADEGKVAYDAETEADC